MKKIKIPPPIVTQLKTTDIPVFRKKLLKAQHGVCAICGQSSTRFCLDHEHKKRLKGSGQIRGVVCSNCNVFLGKSENNCVRYAIGLKQLPIRLRQMADYLEKPHLPYLHPSEAPKPQKLMKKSYNKLQTLYKKNPVRTTFPAFPKSGKLTKPLEHLFKHYNLKPEFYKK
jgi:hypothetical protein